MPGTTDAAHTFTLKIATVDRWSICDPGSLSMKDSEGSEIDTLTFDLDDPAAALTITCWQEVEWKADGTTFLFGGYVTSVTSYDNPSGLGRVLTVRCEGYITLLHKVEAQTVTYTDTTPGAIVAALFTLAGVSGFDVATHVTAGAALAAFTVQNETLAQSLDRLAEIQGWVWRVDAQKNLWFGLASGDQAAFDVSDEANANYSTVYPVEPGVTVKNTADEIKNKIVVHGGYVISAIITDEFNGDGSTQRFNLSHNNINRIHDITVDDVRHRFG